MQCRYSQGKYNTRQIIGYMCPEEKKIAKEIQSRQDCSTPLFPYLSFLTLTMPRKGRPSDTSVHWSERYTLKRCWYRMEARFDPRSLWSPTQALKHWSIMFLWFKYYSWLSRQHLTGPGEILTCVGRAKTLQRNKRIHEGQCMSPGNDMNSS